jgi:predicted RNA-binding protein with RPS1 domain
MGLEKATDQYAVGDVVTCQVIQIKKRGQLQTSDDMEVDAPDTPQRPYYEITLTLREGAQPSKEAQDGNEVDAQIRTGSVLPVKALRVLELVNGKGKGGNSFVPGFAIVEVKSKHILQDSVVGETVECKLPFDQIFDEYNEEWLRSAAALDKQAATVLTVGEKINQKSLVLTDPKKTSTEYKSGTGRLAMISLRPRLVELAAGEKPSDAIPSPETQLYVGAEVVGFVCQIDRRYGAFVRFLDGLTGLVPKVKGGLSLPLYGTVKSKVIAIDVSRKPPKILLDKATPFQATSHVTSEESSEPSFSVGDSIAEAEVVKVDLCRAMLKDLKTKSTCQLRLHCTMVPYRKKKATSSRPHSGDSLPPSHPFFGWNVGMKLSDLEVVSVERRGKSELVDVLMASTVDKDDDKKSTAPTFLKSASSLSKGQPVSGVVASVAKDGSGVWLLVSPTVSGFLPALEISDDTEILNNLGEKFPRGSRLDCFVRAFPTGKQDLQQDRVELTMMKSERKAFMQGDMVVGRVNKKIAEREAPAIMVDLPGGLRGRCCITEVADTDKWKNLPLAMNEVDNQP